MKGIVDYTANEKPLLFHYAGGRFEFSDFNNPNLSDQFFIFIGHDIHKKSVDSAFEGC